VTSFGLLGIFHSKKIQSDTFSQDNIMAYNYSCPPPNISNMQPAMNSTMNLGLDTNCKIDNLGKKVEEIISKLTVLYTLGEKLNKFESVEFINSQFETNKSDVTIYKDRCFPNKIPK